MRISPVFVGFLVACARFLYKENKDIATAHHRIESDRIPKSFDGYKIIHVSDFHNSYFGRKSENLLRKIEEAEGDVIFFTGDIIDRRTPNLKRAVHFLNKMAEMLPTYYVTGNHEAHYKKYRKLHKEIEASGVKNISRKRCRLYHGDEYINLFGMEDLWFYGDENDPLVADIFDKIIKKRMISIGRDGDFTILLSHRPELFEMYIRHPIDLVFSGHAHGGQIRLPFVKALYSPQQGIFPKFTEGSHSKDGTTMFVSRGIGNSRFPFRVFNHPELIVVELKSTDH
ncbi:metallophosphoesterase [Salinicoccus albus]|uniref:metallophosphoesterase n=1 Tax=Salinicoccus albus TaxID=418756 RepID=UPI0003824A2E|nr:metallophosphoesterase [Salinicoccus albus]